MEPRTPTKIAMGMFLTGVSFMILYFAAVTGGYTKQVVPILKNGLEADQYYVDMPQGTRDALGITAEGSEIEYQKNDAQKGSVTLKKTAWLVTAADKNQKFTPGTFVSIEEVMPTQITIGAVMKMSALWLILAYFVISLGELMLSPMGLSLVSKVAPATKRGLMMGGWFLATAIGNKLTAIGAYWDVWSHSKFFLVLAMMAFAMSALLFLLLKPLKKAMPGA
ncbi:MAG: hypothetical protein HQK50_19755 [Oligoflexia bacterium]|nr:hypothetical protein [Oligoflexia bacterium]MBF0367813.1 hypothetical protein [Oligoflexia bacterium]